MGHTCNRGGGWGRNGNSRHVMRAGSVGGGRGRDQTMLKHVFLAGAALMVAGAAHSQAWPTRPVRIIVPWAPGGATDIIGRPLAQKLTENVGQQFIVDNRGGANSLIGTDLAAKASPDGYTFLFNTLAAFTQNT